MRRLLAAFSCVAVALLVASCGDGRTGSPLPTAPLASQSVSPSGGSSGPIPGTCTTLNLLTAEVNAVVPPGSARGAVQGDIGKLQAAINKRDFAGARALAFRINISLIQQYESHALRGTAAQAVKLINDVFCFAGVSIVITDLGNVGIINPTDGPRILITIDGTAGVSFPAGAVSEPTLITLNPIPDTFGENGKGPLHTKLDQYEGFIDISSFSETSAPLVKPAIVAVCPPAGMDPAIRGRLRLGHDAHTGFEITPPADGSFLSCSTTVGTAPSALSRFLGALASVFTPRAAYARTAMLAAGGVGGTAGEFSPFDAVDPDVSFSGGVGGTAGEFQIIPRKPAGLSPGNLSSPHRSAESSAIERLTPGSPSFTVVNGVCADTATFTGGVLEQQCSPGISLETNLGTKLAGAPVTWAVATGGGTVAPATPSPWSCGTFGSTAVTTTDVNGQAHICWTMGATAGTRNNTVTATPSPGGDVPVGVTFVPASGTFTASALSRNPVATATGVTVVYDNAPHAGSGTCSNNLVPVLSYSAAGSPLASAPTNAGSYTLTVTCGDGGVKFVTATSTAAIVITPAPTTTSVSCPTSVVFTGSPLTPCTMTVAGPGLSLHPPAVYSANTQPGTATASYSYAGGGNWLGSSGNASFLITFGFTDGFESASGWATTGFWHRSALTTNGHPIVNAAYPTYVGAAPNDVSHGALPFPLEGSWAAWYGDEAAGNYLGAQAAGDFPNSGGTSTRSNTGTLTSPPITLPATGGHSIMLRFNTWWEIEGVNPSQRDIMSVSVYTVTANTTTFLANLNPSTNPPPGFPASIPFTTGGYAVAPGWVEFAHDLNAFAGRTIQLVYTFNTGDASVNGFRGWLIDNVRIKVEP